MRLGGPELKLPDLKSLKRVKVPTFLVDLYWDLRDRRLLPLVVLALVALVAAPILLSGGSKEEEPQAAAVAPIPGEGEVAALPVVRAEPGLREPSKRLAGLKSKDPFKQHYTAPVLKPGAVPVATASTGGGASTATTTTTTTSSGSNSGSAGSTSPPASPTPAPQPAPAESGSGGGGGAGQITLFTFAIDVTVARTETTKSGTTKMGDPKTLHEVLPTTVLPSQKAPVVTYLGVDPKSGKKALMLISPEVDSVFGDAKCLSGTTSCQLLALEPGVPEVFVYGPGQTRYKVNVLKVEPVASGKISAPQESQRPVTAHNFSK
jgi:hypothetical protein